MQATTDDRGMPSEVELRLLVDELERAVQSLAEQLGLSLETRAEPPLPEAPDGHQGRWLREPSRRPRGCSSFGHPRGQAKATLYRPV